MLATINTYDVWGNEKEGFEVNDTRYYGQFNFDVDINNDNDILDFLNDNYFAIPQSFQDIDFDDDVEAIYVNDAKTGMPLLEVIFDGTK